MVKDAGARNAGEGEEERPVPSERDPELSAQPAVGTCCELHGWCSVYRCIGVSTYRCISSSPYRRLDVSNVRNRPTSQGVRNKDDPPWGARMFFAESLTRKGFSLRNSHATAPASDVHRQSLYASSPAFAGRRRPLMDKQKSRGGRPGVTLEEVRAACEALEKAGRIASTLNVRLELGRGSHSTIQRHLRTLGYASATRISPKKS